MTLQEFQRQIDATYGTRDRARGIDATFRRLVEEVGELARALRDGDPAGLEEEISDVLAWTVTIASQRGVDIARAAGRYAGGCPRCGSAPCVCPPTS
ncbi:MAG: MazG nucleotide pyrophosphohydrolase domain-containing protein [Armatimonadota bacterium]